jgi:hypothetical protein
MNAVKLSWKNKGTPTPSLKLCYPTRNKKGGRQGLEQLQQP